MDGNPFLVWPYANLRVRIRAIESGDTPRLVNAFSRLSLETRSQRFFAHKNVLTAQDLCRLTELDGHTQYALGAFEVFADKRVGNIVGAARFARCVDDPHMAEVGVTVVDDRQGLGIGRNLMQRLVLAAQQRGIHWLRLNMREGNIAMRAFVDRVFGESARPRRDGQLLVFDVAIGGALPRPAAGPYPPAQPTV